MQRFKGTFEVRIENKDYTLRPTFDAMETLCTESGKSERELFEAIQDEKYTVKMIVDIIHAGMMGEYWATNRKAAKLDRRVLGQLMMNQGVTKFVSVAIQFLMFAMVPHDAAVKAVDRMNGFEDEAEDPEPQKKTVG